jgi:hypothetical protein
MAELEWQVLEDEPLPPSEDAEPRPRRRWPWRRLLLTLFVVAAASGLGFWRWLHIQETRLRDDLQRAVLLEERALRFGLAEQLPELVDPTAPDGWTQRYRATFRAALQEWPTPEVLTVERRLDVALVTLAFTFGDAEWQRLRAYRLVDDQWRRTPIPADWWGEPKEYTSEHFTLWMSDRDAAALPPDDLLAYLEAFHTDLVAVWQRTNNEPVTIRIQPFDLSDFTPDVNPRPGSDTFVFNSPLLAEQEALPFLLPTRAYHYTLAQEVAQGIIGPTAPRGQPALQDAVVRYLLLTEEERRQYRAGILNRRTIDIPVTLADGQQLAVPLLLPDYLIEAANPETVARFSTQWADTNNVVIAAEQTFGRALVSLVEEAWLWVEHGAGTRRPAARSEQRTATLLAVTSVEPFRALVAVEEGSGVLDLHLTSDAGLPLVATCLGRGSELEVHQAGGDDTAVEADAINVETLRLPPLTYPPAPPGTETLITRQRGTATQIVALDRQGTETPLFTLPKGAELVIHPREASFAFLFKDECGTSANQYLARYNFYTRAPVNLEGEGHLFWGQQLYLVDDASQQEQPHWTISGVLSGGLGEPTQRPVTSSQQWGHLFGHAFTSRNRRLMQFDDGNLQWLSLVRVLGGRGILLRDAELPLPAGAEIKSVSPDGRWLAYTASGEVENSVVLHVLDLETNRSTLLHYAPAGSTYGEMTWGPGELPTLLVSAGPQVEGAMFSYALLAFDMRLIGTQSFFAQRYFLDGQVSGLHWCDNGRLLYRLTRGAETVLVEGVASTQEPRDLVRLTSNVAGGVEMSPLIQSAELPPDGQVIGCIGGGR